MGRGGRAATKAGVALAAGALPFALGMGTAAADEAYSQSFFTEHTFTAGDGRSVTCSVSGESNLFRPSGAETFHADALTEAIGEDPSCGRTFVEVIATYTDQSGRTKTTGANSINGDVLGVALLDAGLHAAGQPLVAALEAVDEGLGVQPGAAVAEVLEPERLEGDALRLAVEGEGLDDPVLADLVEGAVEAVLLAVAPGDVAPAAARRGVPVEDP